MKGATRSITWLTVAAMATLVLACQEAPVVPAKEEPPPPPPKPTLLGTWERVVDAVDDDGDVRTATERLVFSESGKAFWHAEQLEIFGEERHSPYGHIADYSETEDTITKTFTDWDDQADDWDTMPTTINKSFSLSGSGDVLFVHHWGSNEQEDSFERYNRVQAPVPSNPTLLGTWRYVGGYWDEDGLSGTTTHTLTFTENRYIVYEVQRIDDEIVNGWASSGRWDFTASRVTKTFAHRYRDDDDNWVVEERSFDKEFSWGAAGELFVMDWGDDPENAGDVQSPEIQRYSRVTSPLPPLAGTWVQEWTSERDGELQTDRETITIGDSFTYRRERDAGMSSFSWSYTGSWRQEESKGFLFVDVQSVSVTPAEDWPPDVAERLTSQWEQPEGHEIRIAYAPTGIRNTMTVSRYSEEQRYDENTDMWVDRELFPYGDYVGRFERQGP
jgi:hypothetical protein